MARMPLGKALSVLVAVRLAVPAAAMDAVVPTDAGPSPVPGTSGAAGASVSNSGGGVASVPILSAGLNSPGSAPNLTAPAASPAALAANPAAPAAAGAPAVRAAAPAASAAPARDPASVETEEIPNVPSVARDREGKSAGSRAAAAPSGRGAVQDAGFGAALAGFLNDERLNAAFDGEGAHEGSAAGRTNASVLPAPALEPSARAAAASGPDDGPVSAAELPAPPVPPKTSLVLVLAAHLDAGISGLWAKVKRGFGAKPPPADLAPTIRPKRAPGLDAREGLLVHAPRALRFDALGYRVHFAPPDGAPSEAVADEPARVLVERGDGDEGTEVLRARFSAFNALIEANFAALELMAQSSSKMTVKTGRLVLAKVREMTAAYAKMVGDAGAVEETVAVSSLGADFEKSVKGLSDADLLPAKAVALVMPIDSESMHLHINRLHQDALREVGRTDAESPANLTVKLREGGEERSVSLVDLSEHPLVKNGRLVSPAFKALIEAMRRSKDEPDGSLILQDHQFWGHFRLGAHSAEVYANFLPPDEGGMIRVRYQEWGLGYDNQTRLYYIARLLQRAGFHVEQDNGYLTALVDKDHASQTVDEMTDTFALAVQALHATVGVDYALPLLVSGAKTSEEVGDRIDRWVDVVLGEGTLPFYVHDEPSEMVSGWSKYQALEPRRAELRAALDKTLVRLGLEPIPDEERLGQRTIDRFVNGPIEAAIAGGRLRLTAAGVLEKTPGYDPLADLSRAVSADARAAARMAEAVSSLDPGLFAFETVGSLGALNVERAERRLEPDSEVVVYVLRDPKTGQIGLARAALSDLKPGGAPRQLDPAALFARLADQGFAVAPFTPSREPAGLSYFTRLLKAEPVADRSMGRRAQGLAASPGHGRPVLAQVTYDKVKAAGGGYVFVAPYTSPDDLDAIRASKAVITTSGGLLSHAAITTREMGIPAAILPRARWRDGAAELDVPEFGGERRIEGVAARPLRRSRGASLAEGSFVRLDPAAGTVEIYPDAIGAALLDAEEALSRYDRDGDAGALASWMKDRLGGSTRTDLQKAAVSREALESLAARALTRPAAAADLGRLRAALPKGGAALSGWYARSAAEIYAGMKRDALDFLAEKRDAVKAAISTEAVERALRQAEVRAVRLSAVADALGLPASERREVEGAAAALNSYAKGRAERLLARDVEELKEHARLFPTATVEVLPRLKGAIAKAKRRGAPAGLISGWETVVRALETSRGDSLRARAPAVLPLRQVLDMDVSRAGGKGAKLGEILEVVARAGGEVPPGLALTVDAYRRFLTESGIAGELERVAADPALSPEERSSRARKLILDAPLSAERGVGREIVAALAAEGLSGTPLAVRSSAVDEDGADAAFAGAGDSHLYVDPADLLPHVKDVWASLWNPRALLYRRTKGLSTANLAQAVVVQAMAASDVSGVAFTEDPVTGDSSRLIVNAAFGLGEGIVSGRVAPDQYVVGKALGREVLPPMISDKKLAIVRGKDGRGVEERRTPPEFRRRRSLSPAQLRKLNSVALALENHFGYALDIEFGFVGDKLFILQARPVTNAAAEAPAPPSAAEARRLMFVCGGNTCRSPMAERLAKEKLKTEGRADEFEILSRGLDVAAEGAPMSARAQAALDGRGADPDGHAALGLVPSDVIWADVILTMTSAEAAELRRRYPAAKGKVFALGAYSGVGGDVSDPSGGGALRYGAAAAQIAAAVDSALDRADQDAPVAAR